MITSTNTAASLGSLGSMSTKLSVVIPCRNATATLQRQLEALASQRCSCAWEVVIADNGSNDGLQSVVDNFTGRLCVTIADATARRGQAYARNVGANAATGDMILFVDADDEVAPGYLDAMAAALRRHEFVSAAFDSESLNASWVGGTRRKFQVTGLSDTFGFLPFAGGGGLGIRREVFDRVGGFDATYWRSGEDIDFCWRVQLSGAELHFVPEATARIAWRSRLVDLYRQGRFYGRGEAYLYRRYRREGMPGRRMRDGLAEWIELFRRIPRSTRRDEWGRWLRSYGRRVGRLEGSIRHRVVYP